MAASAWQHFGTTVRGPVRDMLELEDGPKRDAAIGRYDLAKDKRSKAYRLETRQVENEIDYSHTEVRGIDEDGTPQMHEETIKVKRLETEKRETELTGLDRDRAILVAVYGVPGAKIRLEGSL